jgi:hypothetical protein
MGGIATERLGGSKIRINEKNLTTAWMQEQLPEQVAVVNKTSSNS